MTVVAIELLTRRPKPTDAPKPAARLAGLAPYAVEFVSDTDTLLTMCSCSGSSDQPYQG
jgi:hypothetical protein